MKYLPTTSPLRPRVDRHSTDTRPTPVTLRHQLIIDHLFMARFAAHQYALPSVPEQDLFQEAALALTLALLRKMFRR